MNKKCAIALNIGFNRITMIELYEYTILNTEHDIGNETRIQNDFYNNNRQID